jgi:hypothetical protein
MEKNKKRAERRSHKERMLRKAKQVIDLTWRDHDDKWIEWKERWARKHADNLAKCSCHMCGNPRKHWNDTTIQEKKISQPERFCEES